MVAAQEHWELRWAVVALVVFHPFSLNFNRHIFTFPAEQANIFDPVEYLSNLQGRSLQGGGAMKTPSKAIKLDAKGIFSLVSGHVSFHVHENIRFQHEKEKCSRRPTNIGSSS
jgi:hypothetical protein